MDQEWWTDIREEDSPGNYLVEEREGEIVVKFIDSYGAAEEVGWIEK